jgi:hypothetical protein
LYIPDFYIRDYNLILEVKADYRLNSDEVISKKEAAEKKYKYLFITRKHIEDFESFEEELNSIRFND